MVDHTVIVQPPVLRPVRNVFSSLQEQDYKIAQVVTYKLNLLIFRSGDLKTAFYRDTSA